jgi:hypothetical protein
MFLHDEATDRLIPKPISLLGQDAPFAMLTKIRQCGTRS